MRLRRLILYVNIILLSFLAALVLVQTLTKPLTFSVQTPIQTAFILTSFALTIMWFKLFLLEKREKDYAKSLINSLISQSKNELFYSGKIGLAGMAVIRDIAELFKADFVSIWKLSADKEKLTCDNHYSRNKKSFSKGGSITCLDFPEYFDSLQKDPIIVASSAESHPATARMKETYLKENGIKSMLDVPIWFKGELFGVICIESQSLREWEKDEIGFAQILAAFYSFTKSIQQNVMMLREVQEIDSFIDSASIITKTDAIGRITYVNKKFEEVSGWSLAEIIGKDHRVLNSGEHSASFWKAMYKKTMIEKKTWHGIVINRKKGGGLYYVDSYIKANFNSDGEHTGFFSILTDLTSLIEKRSEIEKKNSYLEYAAKILRHDMHSGINTYLPRGLTSLERRLTPDQIRDLKLENPIKLLKEGLKHTQRVYRGVYEFTNIVKKNKSLEKTTCNIKDIMKDYLSSTSYFSQVHLDDSLPTLEVNDSLFCTAIDNLIRNGLKYNDSKKKMVKIYADEENIYVEDNGRGLSQEEFELYSVPYSRKNTQAEKGTGLGLNICKAILAEHGFEILCKKIKPNGTQIKIKIK